ncbi:hypothetical protein IQ07DRAFT_594044 [Pyrenochaeta sp. DS3sAY3a]|nr:hypothetical protein IQ07DRAFT_594044 [Pyrenochaeta sp. DS3sAY3a]
MRPLLRLLLSLATTLLAVALLLFIALGSTPDEEAEQASVSSSQQGSVKALFSFTSPGSLFPPSAIISLTDDNSTFFLARPAAFGPDLPKDGLSGPLWIGVGFNDDAVSHTELGCGDVPGWDDGSERLSLPPDPSKGIGSHDKRTQLIEEDILGIGNDSIDNSSPDGMSETSRQSHRDHISAVLPQNTAGLAGKVALLKRGGCGFLAKVQWAQSRGATAVIVGDDVRGGALIRMYAKGDTSNITIPSLFTSHTTAHLLSSLLPPDHHVDKSGQDAKESDQFHNQQTAPIEQDDLPLTETDSQGPPTKLRWFHSLLIWLGFTDSNSGIAPSTGPVDSVSVEHGLSEVSEYRNPVLAKPRSVTSITGVDTKKVETSEIKQQSHEGLWVTLTPTSVSSSPFFDTLLVLVVSPLVTLSVVYALLLLRSRIRRRRWRAPKSVVERLPVRTYQTISESTSSATPDASSPTTPLLQHSPSQSVTLSPREGVRPESEPPAASSSVPNRSRDREEEKRESGLAAWRRRYGGRQKECVVCLEEYVDGVSQVMSLPCGHEFHADCITPWLVTRRRTCPICKGDVVRSLSQSYHDRLHSPSPTRSPRFLDNADDIQAQAAETRNDSPSASRPLPILIPTSTDALPLDEDVEANWDNDNVRQGGRDIPETRATELSSSLRDLSSTVSTVIWRGLEAVRSSTGLQRRPPPDDVDRDR